MSVSNYTSEQNLTIAKLEKEMLITNRIVQPSFLLPIHKEYQMLIGYIHSKLRI